MRLLQRRMISALLLLLLSALALPGASTPAPAPPPPRLIVVVVIDQFRADYLTRFRDQFGPDGFNRLLREGANFTSCFFPYANTVTGVGHATLATGTTPDRHGIAANDWYDWDKGREVEAVEDERHPLVGGSDDIAGVSPHNLMTTTLADELRLATSGEAKVFGVALKDRAAVFSTGSTASGAYWYDSKTGTMVTSRYYRQALPDWVVAFNQQHAAASYYGKDWKQGERVFMPMTTKSGQPDADYYGQFRFTPYGNQLAVDFALELAGRESLGADAVTDFLFIGFSSNDYVGHVWGPYSDQVADITLRTDKEIARLLHFLDEKVGPGNYWLALSGDHGVAPTLAQARALGLPAKNVDIAAVMQSLNQAFIARWGEGEWFLPEAGLVFNRETLRKYGVSRAEAAHVAGGILLSVPGILGYVAGDEVRVDQETAQAVRRSTYLGRTPDIQVVLAPFALVNREQGGTTHGSPHSYDTHVPLIFFGSAFRPGTYRQQVSPTDLATTLAAALGIDPPALATGEVLTQGLRRPRAKRAAPVAPQ
jgi:arylsulfatase A-like enzyme